MSDLKPGSDSYTVKYLLGEERIPLPLSHRSWNNYIEIKVKAVHEATASLLIPIEIRIHLRYHFL